MEIQEIIEKKLDDIIQLIKSEMPKWEQEPDYVIMRELEKYFSRPKPIL